MSSRRSYEGDESGNRDRGFSSQSPVLTRGLSGDEVVRIVHHKRDSASSLGPGSMAEGTRASSNGAGRSSVTTAVDSVGLSALLREHRERHAQGREPHEDRDQEVSAEEDESDHDHHEEAELSTAQAIDLRHVGGN
jgi:hypothetical protein